MTKAITKTVYRTALKSNKRARGIANGVVMGLASMLVISPAPKKTMRRHVESSDKALRGDFVRIGMDMRKAAATVMANEKTIPRK